MSDQLTKEQQEFAHKAATTVFNCLVFKESHAAAFRKDPNRFAEAHERCAANTPSLSSMPLSFEGLEEHIKLNEELIKSMEGCTEFDECVFVVLVFPDGSSFHKSCESFRRLHLPSRIAVSSSQFDGTACQDGGHSYPDPTRVCLTT